MVHPSLVRSNPLPLHPLDIPHADVEDPVTTEGQASILPASCPDLPHLDVDVHGPFLTRRYLRIVLLFRQPIKHQNDGTEHANCPQHQGNRHSQANHCPSLHFSHSFTHNTYTIPFRRTLHKLY